MILNVEPGGWGAGEGDAGEQQASAGAGSQRRDAAEAAREGGDRGAPRSCRRDRRADGLRAAFGRGMRQHPRAGEQVPAGRPPTAPARTRCSPDADLGVGGVAERRQPGDVLGAASGRRRRRRPPAMSRQPPTGVPSRASRSARGGARLVVRLSCSPGRIPGNDMYGRQSTPPSDAAERSRCRRSRRTRACPCGRGREDVVPAALGAPDRPRSRRRRHPVPRVGGAETQSALTRSRLRGQSPTSRQRRPFSMRGRASRPSRPRSGSSRRDQPQAEAATPPAATSAWTRRGRRLFARSPLCGGPAGRLPVASPA